jgi:hypothetical protein
LLKKNIQSLHIVPFFVVLAFAVATYFIDQNAFWFVFTTGKVEGVAEWFQAFFYFFASLIFMRLGVRLIKNSKGLVRYLPLLFGLFVLFVALEEISWGQKLFGFDTPEEIAVINSQGELTVHNLYPVQAVLHLAYIFAGLALSFLTLFRSETSKSLKPSLKNYLPSKTLIPYFMSVSIFYFTFDYVNPLVGGLIENHQEVAETMFSLGILIWAFSIQRDKQANPENFRNASHK